MSDIQLHVRNKEDCEDHVIDCPPDMKASDFLTELVEGLQLPPGDWVLDDEETGITLDPQVSLSSNRVANGHHLRLRKNGVILQRPPRKGHTPEPPPSKEETEEEIPKPPYKREKGEQDKKGEIEPPPDKTIEHWKVEWKWILASLAAFLVVGLVVTGIYRLMHRVSVTVTPAQIAIDAGHSTRFVAEVMNSSNQGIRWTLEPALGRIDDSGTYQAPPVFEPGQRVKITATSLADPSKSSSAQVTLHAIPHIVINPVETTALESQQIKFNAKVTGTSSEAVRWSISPEVGSISADGTYSAPKVIATPGAITVTATSQADPGLTVSATVILKVPTVPIVSVQLTPTEASLSNNGQMVFRARVNGTANQRVVWSASQGTITQSGAYTAPAMIEPGETAVILARSVVNPAKFGRVVIELRPNISIRINPPEVVLGPARRQQQFTAFVNGTSNTSVKWSTTSGSITPSGLYTSPPPKTAQQSIRVMATSDVDPTKEASAWVTVEAVAGKNEITERKPAVAETSGLILWSGVLEPGQTVTINRSQPSTGIVLRGGLPGVPISVKVTPLELVGIQEAPGPSNEWSRLVLRSKKRLHAVIIIEWNAVQ